MYSLGTTTILSLLYSLLSMGSYIRTVLLLKIVAHSLRHYIAWFSRFYACYACYTFVMFRGLLLLCLSRTIGTCIGIGIDVLNLFFSLSVISLLAGLHLYLLAMAITYHSPSIWWIYNPIFLGRHQFGNFQHFSSGETFSYAVFTCNDFVFIVAFFSYIMECT